MRPPLRVLGIFGIQRVVDKEALGPPEPFRRVDEGAQQSLEVQGLELSGTSAERMREVPGDSFLRLHKGMR